MEERERVEGQRASEQPSARRPNSEPQGRLFCVFLRSSSLACPPPRPVGIESMGADLHVLRQWRGWRVAPLRRTARKLGQARMQPSSSSSPAGQKEASQAEQSSQSRECVDQARAIIGGVGVDLGLPATIRSAARLRGQVQKWAREAAKAGAGCVDPHAERDADRGWASG